MRQTATTCMLIIVAVALAIGAPTAVCTAQKPAAGFTVSTTQPAKKALAELNSLIGGWRGIGQPRRGSASGSWAEKAEWLWDFSQPSPAIRYEVSKGKLIKSARLTFDDKSGLFQARVTLADGSTRQYAGKLAEDRLVLQSKPDAKNEIHRISITRLNEKRTVVLFEKGRAAARVLGRVAEVGYTREGTRLAVEGGDGPECIVTGGKGTIAVTYKGQTYYVCCSGCKQAFNENPEKILAEYKKRLEERTESTK